MITWLNFSCKPLFLEWVFFIVNVYHSVFVCETCIVNHKMIIFYLHLPVGPTLFLSISISIYFFIFLLPNLPSSPLSVELLSWHFACVYKTTCMVHIGDMLDIYCGIEWTFLYAVSKHSKVHARYYGLSCSCTTSCSVINQYFHVLESNRVYTQTYTITDTQTNQTLVDYLIQF